MDCYANYEKCEELIAEFPLLAGFALMVIFTVYLLMMYFMFKLPNKRQKAVLKICFEKLYPLMVNSDNDKIIAEELHQIARQLEFEKKEK